MNPADLVVATFAIIVCLTATAQPAAPTGEIKGDAWVHTPESLTASAQQADACLPAAATGGAVFCGKFNALPPVVKMTPTPALMRTHKYHRAHCAHQ